MTTQQELIELLTSDPSNENIKLAVDWIKSQKRKDKSTMHIVEALIENTSSRYSSPCANSLDEVCQMDLSDIQK